MNLPPTILLTCCCCGAAIFRRQWHNRVPGFVLCNACADEIQYKEAADMRSNYGFYQICEPYRLSREGGKGIAAP